MPIGGRVNWAKATIVCIVGYDTVKIPTRSREMLPRIIKVTPTFVIFLDRYSFSPMAKIRLSIPPIIKVLLKSKDTSPTPSALIAFVSHLNQGEI